jgi:hypothetical protein
VRRFKGFLGGKQCQLSPALHYCITLQTLTW